MWLEIVTKVFSCNGLQQQEEVQYRANFCSLTFLNTNIDNNDISNNNNNNKPCFEWASDIQQ